MPEEYELPISDEELWDAERLSPSEVVALQREVKALHHQVDALQKPEERSDDTTFVGHDALTRVVHEMGYRDKYAMYRKGTFGNPYSISTFRKMGVNVINSIIDSADSVDDKTKVKELRGRVDALQREVKALREEKAKAADEAEELRSDAEFNSTLAARNVEEVLDLRSELEWLGEVLKAAKKALREKEQELESAYKVFRKVLGRPVTPQQPLEDKDPDYPPPHDRPVPTHGTLPEADILMRNDLKPYYNPTSTGKTGWQNQKEGGDTGG
jgi:polyhydroxyalkanoate synthesis regulator phasin